MTDQTDQTPEESGKPRRLHDRARDAAWSAAPYVAFALGRLAIVRLSSGRARPGRPCQRPQGDPLPLGDLAALTVLDSTKGIGRLVQCVDETWSRAGGRQGACSHHGGIA